jgi:DNA polymerase-3 subunit delta'
MFPDFVPGDFEPGPHRQALIGYPRLLEAIDRAAAGGRLAHAYLLAGPPAVGKRAAAMRFAQALLCPHLPAQERPCGHCRTCRLTLEVALPDLHWRDPPLKVDAARALQSELALAPVEGRLRVAILPEIELASPSAANSLLKTLEEPPGHAVLILTSAQQGEVLPTIRSRCQVLAMRPLTPLAVSDALQAEWDAGPEQAELLGRLSGGRLGWAASALRDESTLEGRQGWLDALAELLASGRSERFARAEALAKDSGELPVGLGMWLGWWRDLLLLHSGVDRALVNRDRLDGLRQAAGRYGLAETLAATNATDEAIRCLAANTNPRLTLEVLFSELP